jgi:hypothetical protein
MDGLGLVKMFVIIEEKFKGKIIINIIMYLLLLSTGKYHMIRYI